MYENVKMMNLEKQLHLRFFPYKNQYVPVTYVFLQINTDNERLSVSVIFSCFIITHSFKQLQNYRNILFNI